MNWCIVLLILFFEAAAGRTCCSEGKYRLSGDVQPTFYSIEIHPNLDTETFTGKVFMHITIKSSVESIEFHSKNLNIKSLYLDTEEVYFNSCFCYGDFAFEYADFDLVKIFRRNRKLIPPGTHAVYIEYDGLFSHNRTEGMFKTGFTKNGTTLSHLLATDFQPTHARQVFPCFDEPSFKARYQLDLVVPNNSYVALSNMRVKEKFEISDGIVYKFETTPLMSIYLLSFVITKHTYSEYIDENNIPYRIYSFYAAEENNTKLSEFASEVIRFYSNYTNYPYTLPKIDFVEYDRKESAATENWGLVTFNTSLLCSENDFYDLSQKKAVMAHELAHFWFGNLVTNYWWDDIWLQESLATYMEIKAEDAILKNNVSQNFFSLYLDNLFALEVHNTSTPVVHFQEDPIKIRENFNDITYVKGATVLRMTEMVIGEKKMRDVIKEYVRKYAFKTATTPDFLAVVSEISGDVTVREFMESYLYQSRFPIIYIEEEEDSYVLKQSTFIPEAQGHFQSKSQFRYRWTIPITYTTNLNSTSTLVWFHKNAEKLTLPKNNAAWIKLNYQQISYYRTNYSDQLWEAFMQHDKELEPSEKSYLLFEALGLFNLKLRSCDLVLKYFWNFGPFDTESSFAVYWKLNDIVSQYNDIAAQNLKDFFYRILFNEGKKRTAKRFLEDITETTKKTDKQPTEQEEACILWLINESTKYNSSSEDELVSE